MNTYLLIDPIQTNGMYYMAANSDEEAIAIFTAKALDMHGAVKATKASYAFTENYSHQFQLENADGVPMQHLNSGIYVWSIHKLSIIA